MIEIREATPDEYTEIGELTHRAYAALPDIGDLGWYGDQLRDIAGRAADATILVAVEAGRIVGDVTWVPHANSPAAEWDEADAAGFRMLAVDPSAQGQGVGEAMVKDMIERATALDKASVLLYTTDFMQSAQRLYRRLGFVRHPEIDLTIGRRNPVQVMGFRLGL